MTNPAKSVPPNLPKSFPSNWTGNWSGWHWVDGAAVYPTTHGVER